MASRTGTLMRLLVFVAALPLVFALGARPVDRLGVGVATVEVGDGVHLDLFTAPHDATPAATIRIREDEANLTFRLDPPAPEWLRPAALSLDYSLFAFRVLTVADEAFEVVVDETSGRTLWLRAQPGVEYKPWAQYLVENVTGFDRLDPASNPLRVAPDAEADAIPYDGQQGWDCLAVAEVQGEWVRVRRSDLCVSGEPVDGWIRWRDGEELLISYGLTC